IDANDPVGRRLADLGLVPKTRIRTVRRAPLGDPTVYELRGYRLCLRRNEAARSTRKSTAMQHCTTAISSL
ncbi:MAG: ferrous iron transport protein A, partial [Acidimicrobiia bacterium]